MSAKGLEMGFCEDDTIAELLWDSTRHSLLFEILFNDCDLKKDPEIAILAEEMILESLRKPDEGIEDAKVSESS